MNVVGTIFIQDEKLLIDKPRKRTMYQMIGGKVEKGKQFSKQPFENVTKN